MVRLSYARRPVLAGAEGLAEAEEHAIAFSTDGTESRKGQVTFAGINFNNPTGLVPPLPDVPEVRIVEAPGANLEAPLDQLYSEAVTLGRRREAKQILKSVVPALDDLEILTEAGSPILHVVFNDHSVPIALAGEGIYALTRLTLELATRRCGVVLLEEPEIHQHPAALRLCARVIWATVERDIQVILTTHSLDLIDMLLAEAPADKLDRLSVFRFRLDNGRLLSSQTVGADVALSRTEIQDDLR
ncbi:MAG: AAA family ATPase [Candidatus Xenobia bacterium]